MTKRKPKEQISKIYWDSSVWIAWYNNEFDLRGLCTSLLKKAEAGQIEIVTSTLSVTEFCPPTEAEDLRIEEYLKRSHFLYVQVDRGLAHEARRLIRKYPRLPAQDAIHLACAVRANCDIFHTTDSHFMSRASEIEEVHVCWPDWPEGQTELIFDETAYSEEPNPEQ